MDITEVVKLADELIFMKIGKHLDYLQKAVLRGTFQGKTYAEISEENYSSEGHIRNTGSELWKLLSEVLGQEITKANFRAIIEKVEFNNFSATNVGHVTVNHLNFCTDTKLTPTDLEKFKKKPTQQHLDLHDAPEVLSFYGRTNELASLQNWIINEQIRLITLLGLRGIGKTTLAIHLIHQIKIQFDYIIYRSLCFSPTPETTLTNLLQIFSPAAISTKIETQLSQLLDYLRKYRCLIILDDVEMLFSSQQLAGQYKTGCETYQRLFKLISEVNHNSCVLLIGSEPPREIANFSSSKKPCRAFILGGLGMAAEEILQEHNLADDESWQTLIDIYQGNPLWLQLTGTLIKKLCGGRVAEFLQFGMPFICESLRELLDEAFQRLTEQEKAILYKIACEAEQVSWLHILKAIQISPVELFNAMQSLKSRLLVEGIDRDKTTFFTMDSIVKEYVKIQLRETT
ncbi:NB-ARC domain-containing protein [Microcoleus sp. herbarium8]|uniref:NB-ARC domain-containing protein n=1 Tax=Microcoleus sp. herbarium8 TaxID=3055436 RepID=UPI002FD5A7D1